MRIPIIAGNWKLHNTIEESLALVKGLHYGLPWPGEVEVVVAPPYTALHAMATFLQDSYIRVAAQNMFWEPKGAYTGEISAPLLKDAGADYVIIGHSERRQYFGETNQTANQKLVAALDYDLIPILCVGESLEEREAGHVAAVVEQQIQEGLANIMPVMMEQVVVAYEPIWAIGTGKTATPEQAEEVHGLIRGKIADIFGVMCAEKVRILYGGSVKPSNSCEILSQPNIDGALVGGASLKAEDFIAIVRSVG